MIFKPQLARAVESGRKTATRRPIRGDEPCRYKVGHDYAVQPGRGKPAICRMKVLSVDIQRVGDITHAEAKAEGFKTTAAFKAYWTQLYSAKWVQAQEADITEDLGGCLSEPELVHRFEAAHADTMVWAIRFEVAQDLPRFLAPPGGGTALPVDRNELGNPEDVVTDYTHTPARAVDDLECVDEATLARYSHGALGFCIGKQLQRAQEAAEQRKAKRNPRLAMFRDAA